MPIPAQYIDAIKTWLRNNANKAVKTADENWEYRTVPDSDPVEYVMTDPVLDEQGEVITPAQRIVDITSTVTYLDVGELLWRLRRKIIKLTPATAETLSLEDMHELFDPYLETIRSHIGVDSTGGVPFDEPAVDAEDPDA